MNPDAVGHVQVRAGHVERHRASRRVHPLDADNRLLAQVVADQGIADLQQLCRTETPLVAPAHEERVLEGYLDPIVDQVETLVFAVGDRSNAGDARRHLAGTAGPEPAVLSAVVGITFQSGHIERGHLIAGHQVFDGDQMAVGLADERTVEEAVAAAVTRAAARTATSRSAAATPAARAALGGTTRCRTPAARACGCTAAAGRG